MSPLTEKNGTSVDVYLPDDIFYDWNGDFSPGRGSGARISLSDIDYTTIPSHIRGGNILPLRMESANTTAEVRTKGFHILVAPGLDAQARGSLYWMMGFQSSNRALLLSISHATMDHSSCLVNTNMVLMSALKNKPSRRRL